ncbi:MAG: ABC transporter permease [Spirochaetia bacterium]|nr:ABC transporter permease [Spirochaetia bacterium]
MRRYLGGRGNQIFSMNAWLSFLGVFIGTSLLVIVLSVFNGFQQQIKSSIFKFDPHITIESTKKPGKVEDWRNWIIKINTKLGNGAESVSGMIQSPALIRKDEQLDHVLIRGMEFPEDAKVKDKYTFPKEFPKVVEPANLKNFPKGDYCLIGHELAGILDIHVGDLIQLIVPKGQFTARVGVEPGMKTFTVSGFFSSGNYQYDSKVILISLPAAQSLYGAGDSVQQIAIKLKDFDAVKKSLILLYEVLPYDYSIRSIEEEHRNLFAALKWEKVIMTIIVFLFIIAALVGVIVSTANVIRSKKKDIGILKSIGVSDQEILIVFTLIGFISGLIGTILGVSFGIFLSMKLELIINGFEYVINGVGQFYCDNLMSCFWSRVELMPKDVYYFDHMPVSIDARFLHPLSILAIFLSGMAALVPAWSAGKLQPIDIIRASDT